MPDTSFAVSFPLVNGTYLIDTPPGSTGQLEMLLNASRAPSAGTLRVEGLQWLNGQWVACNNASAINLASTTWPVAVSDYAHYRSLRFILTGIVGGGGTANGMAYCTQNALMMGQLNGTAAQTTQPFTDVSMKQGTAYFSQVSLPSIAVGATYNVLFTTGTQPVVLQDLRVYAQVTNLSVQLFKAPTFTGGTAVPALNFNDINPVATTTALSLGATVSAIGTAWGDPIHLYGASTVGNIGGSSIQTLGTRLLAPGRTYLLQFKNAATLSAAAPDLYLSWLEGITDLPRA